MRSKLKTLLTVGFIGWFFMFKHEFPAVSGVNVVTGIGPFATEAACKAEYESVKEFLESMGIKFTIQKCEAVSGA